MSQRSLFTKRPTSKSAFFRQYDALAKTRLSKNFILRDFLFSTQSVVLGLSNYPEHPEHVILAGKALCEKVLEPILEHFGQFAVTFAYQSRETLEHRWSPEKRQANRYSSNPHQWDRGTFGKAIYARVDILPFCVEDGLVTKKEFGKWCMYKLDIDLLMHWHRGNIFCITISPRPRRAWIEWGDTSLNQPKRTDLMGTRYWQEIYPTLPEHERPRFAPSCTGGSLQWCGD
ncbi:hypothetical protein C8R26_1481 [Nitrosomonas oligotropha]|uniref:Uncharacterized protein n=1 Tax=Nitrosomonas oligotropha TaxID=42354 RepID=A0A2T5H4L5_9PROT|nr:hypothetical protein [Nitrosomonas oligotropha]PTQ66535.1 hypothetical protein C8R26_1481 [Nitrosomonas oligotropha]